MRPPDALTGWDKETNAERYDQFTCDYPFYTVSSHDLVQRADLADTDLAVDLCGGTGVTAAAALAAMPTHGRVITIDNAPAMHVVGQRTRTDPRITWMLADAENVASAITEPVDAVLCNAGVWKTDTIATFAGVRSILRPGGRFVFNIGGGFAGLTASQRDPRPSLNDLITAIAVRDFGYTPALNDNTSPILTEPVVRERLRNAGLTLLAADVVTQHGTLEEKRAWLSIPLFARPPGRLPYDQRMAILEQAYREIDPDRPTATQWLVITAER
ncbi:class I SAM-dependent methyltransferase [Dactylosporangium siamense]|uniref:Methyltransferase domain-containing protein n=1 Tax=Dactylosporangium siamense TaxID=685454 RepID=A0A919Q2V2_9ACTN|nr:class I SAM-dependent methyltransferase [Dactylosporangium siamense]GIG52865.1 hypothetical protein Dsi01nite_109060 [Dactylosporangium siamense]